MRSGWSGKAGGTCTAGRAATTQQEQWVGEIGRTGKAGVKLKAEQGGALRNLAKRARLADQASRGKAWRQQRKRKEDSSCMEIIITQQM